MSFIFKPQSSKPGKGVLFLAPSSTSGGAPTITDPATGKVYTGRFINNVEGNKQWEFPVELRGLKDLQLSYGGQTAKIASGSQSYEGNDLSSWQPRDKGSFGGPGGATGLPPGFEPGNFNGLGFFPAFLGEQFPNAQTINAAPYNFTDPTKFAQAFGAFNRNEITKNYNLSKELSLDTLGTELAALKGYVPAAAALKRQETSIDNQFNQAQRTAQVNQAMPGAIEDLTAQADRARTLSTGRLPSSIEDRALEVGVRSASADRSAAGGFGAQSSVARSTSDLMSAEQRLNLSKYGDQLTSQNITQRQNLLLAPTEYSNAGTQIQVNPTVSPSQLISNNLANLNQNTLINPATALQSQTQQNQFTTQLQQQTNEFNANNLNTFALQKFGYMASYAGAVAGAGQTAANTQLQMQLMQQYQNIFQQYQHMAQQAGTIGSIAQGLGTILPQISATINSISNLFGSNPNSSPSGTNDLGVPNNFNINATPENPTGNTPPAATPNIDINSPNPIPNFGTEYNPGTEAPSYTLPPTDSSGGSSPTDLSARTTSARAPAQTRISSGATQTQTAPTRSVQEFNQLIGAPQNARLSPEASQAVAQGARVLGTAGVHATPGQGRVPIGYDNQGQALYGDAPLVKSNDINLGKQMVDHTATIVQPLNVLSAKDQTNLQAIGNVASNASTIATLTAQAQKGDKTGFVNTLLAALKQPLIGKATDNPKSQDQLNTIASAYLLFSNWDRMSPAQQSIAIASTGIGVFKTATGQNLNTIPLVKDSSLPGGALTLGQGLSLLQTGVNIYSLVNNWDSMSTLGKVAGTTGTAAGIANIAQHFGLFNASSPTVNALGDVAGVAGVALGANQVMQNWGKGGTKGAIQGGLGALGVDLGLYALGATNPYLLAGVAAVSILGDAIKTGKSGAQMERDGVRSVFQKAGLANKDFQVTLADGTKADIGIDGHGGQHTFAHPELLPKGMDNKKLSSYDLDFTNHLDYSVGMGGTALARLLTGGKNTPIDQLGAQLGNAALGNVGFGKDMTVGNFNKSMANLRSMYAQSGIKSKEQAYAITAEARKQGRISAADAVTMQQAFNMMYDKNGYETAQRLFNGQKNGVQVAVNNKDKTPPVIVAGHQGPAAPTITNTKGQNVTLNIPGVKGTQPLTKKQQNAARYKQPFEEAASQSV